MRHSNEIIESHVAGIPCQIRINDFVHVKPDPTTWASADDFYGYTEIDWDVLDRKGYEAGWLQRKLTDKDRDRIDQEIIDHYLQGELV